MSVAKAGVDALSNSVAIEFGPRGITSNVIAPGPIAGTEGMERLARKEDAAAGKKQIPLGRWGTVKEIADATIYLFSEAAGYVNGTTLVGKCKVFHFPALDVKLLPFLTLISPLWLLRLLSFAVSFDFLRIRNSDPAATHMINAALNCAIVVDGGSWRTQSTNPSSGFLYPDFLLGDEVVSGVKGTKKSKL